MAERASGLTTFGVLLDLTSRPPPGEAVGWLDVVVEQAVRSEQLGFERLWLQAGSTAELAFYAGAVAARTVRIGLGLVVSAGPKGLPRRWAGRAAKFGRQIGRNLAVGLLIRPNQRRFAINSGRVELELLCPGAALLDLAPADRAFWVQFVRQRSGVAGATALSLVVSEEVFDDPSLAGGPAEIYSLLALLGEDVEIVFAPGSARAVGRGAMQTLERFGREVTPHFQPLPLLEPPTFV